MQRFEPFLATLEMVTPVILRASLTLDAILIGENALYVGDAAAIRDVPLAKRNGVPLASQAYLDAVDMITVHKAVTMRQTEASRMPLHAIALGRRASFSGEAYKNTLNTYEGISVRRIVFAGVGDTDAIRDVLEDVRGIGTRRADGFGMISSCTVEPFDADPAIWGLVDPEGEPMRPVPLAMWANLGGTRSPVIQAVRARPFYWDVRNPAEACAVPPDMDAVRLIRMLEAAA